MARKVTRTKTEYDVQLQVRDGKPVAIIEVETFDVFEDGRGFAGQTRTGLQTLIVPAWTLADLTESITRTLAFQALSAPEDTYDLTVDAKPSVGLYSPQNTSLPVDTFYTVSEARVALQACAKGYLIAHLPEKEGESILKIGSIIEANQ